MILSHPAFDTSSLFWKGLAIKVKGTNKAAVIRKEGTVKSEDADWRSWLGAAYLSTRFYQRNSHVKNFIIFRSPACSLIAEQVAATFLVSQMSPDLQA